MGDPVLAGSTPRPDVVDRPPDRSDAELMLDGSAADFGVLFDRYAVELYRYCARRIGPDLADDVVAETFLVAYEHRHRYDRSRPSARPWLYGVATNLLRRQRSAARRASRAAADAARTFELAVDGGYQLAERAAERADAEALARAMSGALALLPARQRDVLLMYAAGLGYAEIAAALDIPLGTVMSRLHRARLRLRGSLPTEIVTSRHPVIGAT